MRLIWFPLFAVCALGQGFTNLGPEHAREQALRSHPLVASGQARIESAEGFRQQATLRPNPRLFLQAENGRFGSTNTPFRFANETDDFLYVSQVLEGPGKRTARIELGNQSILRRKAELELTQLRVAQNVALAYWSAAGAEHVRSVLRQSVDNFDRTVQYHRDRVREGAMAEVDLIRIQLEREQVSVQLQNAEQDVRRLRLQLLREMGVPADMPDVVLTGDMTDVRPYIADATEDAIRNRRDLQLARQLVQQANAAVRVEQVHARPDTEVLFGYKRTAGLNTMIAGVQLSLPFRNRNQGAISASLAEVKASEHDLRSIELTARAEIAVAQSEYSQKLQLVTVTLPQIQAQADETVRIARAVYREGASDLLRLLDAERTGLQARLLAARTLTEYRLALVNLQAATGIIP